MIHHTDCGMETVTNETIRNLLSNSLEPAKFDGKNWLDVGKGPGSRAGEYMDFLPFCNLEQSVIDDVERIRTHPLVPGYITIYGFIYDVKSGRLIEVPEANRIGRATI